jgi:hypothetical protein
MSLAESIYRHSLGLPESAAREALAFIQFLEHRHGVVASNPALQSDTAKREAALTRLANVRLHFGGKPIANRDELYDGSRG